MIEQPQEKRPALTVVVQSWWTPILAFIALVVGLVAGYFGRPLLYTGETANPSTAVNTAAPTTATGQALIPTTEVDPTMAAISNQQQLMDYLVSHTTHFKGDANAKVTIIEFSDYQ